MKIIHIASHSGNLGDLINHKGFYAWLETITQGPHEICKIEIRDFYFNNYK